MVVCTSFCMKVSYLVSFWWLYLPCGLSDLISNPCPSWDSVSRRVCWSASLDPTWIWKRRVVFERLLVKFYHFNVRAFPLDSCSWDTEVRILQWDNCKCTAAGSKLEICCLGKKGASKGHFGALVGFRLSCLKFNRNSVLIATCHLRYRLLKSSGW